MNGRGAEREKELDRTRAEAVEEKGMIEASLLLSN